MRLSLINRLTFIISLLCFSCTPVQAEATNLTIAQTPNRNPSSKPSPFVPPPLPPSVGTPGQRRSEAGSRPQSCRQGSKPLTALVPTYSSKDSETVWGTTAAGQPTFWFYAPYSSTSASGEFVMENAAKQQTIYKVPLKTQPGIMRVSLANTNISLQMNQPYRWYFNVYCQSNREEVDSYVEGDVTRQSLSSAVQNQITQANSQQQVGLFAANGIWYEALTAAATLHCTRPSDSSWTELLQAIGLSDLVQEPISDCQSRTK